MIIEFKKKLIIVGIILILFLIIITIFLNKKPNKNDNRNIIIPTEEAIPTVDSSVQVNFQPLNKGEVVLKIKNEPKNTKEIDFELSYQVVNNDLADGGETAIEQGALGKCYRFDNYWQCGEASDTGGRKIILGTCSSGTCRYHNIVGPIKVVLKFSGAYGEKIFEKEFNI